MPLSPQRSVWLSIMVAHLKMGGVTSLSVPVISSPFILDKKRSDTQHPVTCRSMSQGFKRQKAAFFMILKVLWNISDKN